MERLITTLDTTSHSKKLKKVINYAKHTFVNKSLVLGHFIQFMGPRRVFKEPEESLDGLENDNGRDVRG